MTTITTSRPAFTPSALVVARVDSDVAELLDEDGAAGMAASFWAIIDRSRHAVRACKVELRVDGSAHLLIETAREFFPDDLQLVS